MLSRVEGPGRSQLSVFVTWYRYRTRKLWVSYLHKLSPKYYIGLCRKSIYNFTSSQLKEPLAIAHIGIAYNPLTSSQALSVNATDSSEIICLQRKYWVIMKMYPILYLIKTNAMLLGTNYDTLTRGLVENSPY